MNTPILLLIFNRPHYTEETFSRIREVKPSKLYIAADGPRKNVPDDKQLCQKTRDIINQVDWDCEVKTLFRDENLGCKDAISSAVTWFFEHEEIGIIIEDDIFPDLSFFPFCEELLIKYKDDTRINHIAGYASNDFYKKNTQDYYFTHFMNCWGWASWRRSWQYYNKNKDRIETFLNYEITNVYQDKAVCDNIKQSISLYYKNHHSWDWVYNTCLMMENSLCINPSVNLVKNLDSPSKTQQLTFPLKHPDFIIPDNQNENKIRKKEAHLVLRYYFKKLIPHKALMMISKILRVFAPTQKLRSLLRKIDTI